MKHFLISNNFFSYSQSLVGQAVLLMKKPKMRPKIGQKSTLCAKAATALGILSSCGPATCCLASLHPLECV